MDLTEGVNVAENSKGRRKRPKLSAKALIARKNQRYACKDPDLENWVIPCNHTKKQNYKCREIDLATLKFTKAFFYKEANKNEQNMRLATLLKISKPEQNRQRNAKSYKPHELQIQYIIRHKKTYVVCRAFFKKLLKITSRRILFVGKKLHRGDCVKINSDGERRAEKQLPKFEKVKEFIGKFKAQESHYSRSKSQRLYLHSSLTIRKMWKMYDADVPPELKVNYSYFHKIFSTEFNLGFGSPATDVCSYCEKIKYQIKKNPDTASLQRDLQVHQARAKQFSLLLKEKRDDEVTFCLDLQQVQNLPKIPIQETFYSLQLAFYCFCIVGAESKGPNFYVWTENQSGLGSNEIGSALLHFLRNAHFDESITKVRLFCDGCGGQNKNCHILHVLIYWLQKESPKFIKEIQLTFPVRGHSYLPADRVFGRVEKELRRNDRIILPSEYINIYKKFGEVLEIEKDWIMYDLKDLLNVSNKYQGISEQKIISFNKVDNKKRQYPEVTITSQVFYRNQDTSKKPKTLLKRGKSLVSTSLKPLTLKHPISADKGKAVNNLLASAFGKDWRLDEGLKFYFELLINDIQGAEETPEIRGGNNIEACECIEEEPELKL